jgi:hypothetical protein
MNEETYKALFKILKELVRDYNPRIIKTDFEYAAINAMVATFPVVRISGCMFQLEHAIMRKNGELNLKYLYQTNNNIKNM